MLERASDCLSGSSTGANFEVTSCTNLGLSRISLYSTIWSDLAIMSQSDLKVLMIDSDLSGAILIIND